MTYAIYKPKINSPAWEYSEFAVSLYQGCTDAPCDYCFMSKMNHRFNKYFGKAKLKDCFKDDDQAYDQFCKDLLKHHTDLKEKGLFFMFNSDPCLSNTYGLCWECIDYALAQNVPVKVLTKQTWWVDDYWLAYYRSDRNNIAIGYTLTGKDKREPGASPNFERINAMAKLHNSDFKTLASIEPIIDIESSRNMIEQSLPYCDHYKIGLESGKKYNSWELQEFWQWCVKNIDKPIYFKDSFLKAIGIDDRDMMNQMYPNCVNRDFNMFKLKDLHS